MGTTATSRVDVFCNCQSQLCKVKQKAQNNNNFTFTQFGQQLQQLTEKSYNLLCNSAAAAATEDSSSSSSSSSTRSSNQCAIWWVNEWTPTSVLCSSNCPAASTIAALQLQLSQRRRRRWQNPPLYEAAGLFMHGSQWNWTAPLIDGSDQTDWLTDWRQRSGSQCVDKVKSMSSVGECQWEWDHCGSRHHQRWPTAAVIAVPATVFSWAKEDWTRVRDNGRGSKLALWESETIFLFLFAYI